MKKRHVAFLTVLFVLFIMMFLGSAFYARKVMTDEYDKGVQYYEDSEYEAAMEVFLKLYGWGRGMSISPEDYYNMALAKLTEQNSDVVVCPNCGWPVRN